MEWIEYDNTYKSFCDYVGDVVGYQIVVDGETYLIGDINPNKGVCGDCVAFYDDDVVEEYRKII